MRTLTFSLAFLVASAAPMTAQNVNNSDAINFGTITSTVAGIYSPSVATGLVSSSVQASAVTAAMNSLAAPGGVLASAIPGATTNQAASAAVLALVAGGSTQALATALAADGAPAAETATALAKLSALGSSPTPAAVVEAVLAFNAMINASSAAFLSSPSVATVVAMHSVLSALSKVM